MKEKVTREELHSDIQEIKQALIGYQGQGGLIEDVKKINGRVRWLEKGFYACMGAIGVISFILTRLESFAKLFTR